MNRIKKIFKCIERKISSFVSPELVMLYKRKRSLDRKTKHQTLKNVPRYTKTEVTLLDKIIIIPDNASFLFMHDEIFKEEIYKFNTSSNIPYFIDGGANIGLATIYLKNRFPKAEILAFEPDEYIHSFLKSNINKFGFENIEIINKGLWNTNVELEFMSEGADAGILTNFTKDKSVSSKVKVISLKPYLNRKVDFLKLDIEGSETIVLKDIEQELNNVDKIFVEYHSFVNQKQSINEIITILSNANFRLYMTIPGNNKQRNPLLGLNEWNNMDFQLNIFGYKENI